VTGTAARLPSGVRDAGRDGADDLGGFAYLLRIRGDPASGIPARVAEIFAAKEIAVNSR
jgi:hypothetical protein